jgi:Holliday junction resolvase RusA-like endonuclease
MKYNIIPVTKPRQTQRDLWAKRPCVMKYRAFADEVRANKIMIPSGGAHITFIIPFPKSYSKKKKKELDGKPYMVKKRNDIDNLQKALMDAIFEDDSHIWDIRCTKLWGYEGAIIIE